MEAKHTPGAAQLIRAAIAKAQAQAQAGNVMTEISNRAVLAVLCGESSEDEAGRDYWTIAESICLPNVVRELADSPAAVDELMTILARDIGCYPEAQAILERFVEADVRKVCDQPHERVACSCDDGADADALADAAEDIWAAGRGY